MGDYIRKPVFPEKSPYNGVPLNENLECLKGDGWREYLFSFWVWH
jgi:hypothetical protein